MRNSRLQIRMIKTRKFLVSCLLICLVGHAHAESREQKIFPDHKGTWVNDFANLIGHKDSERISSLCDEVFQEGLATIVVCTIQSIPKVEREYENIVLYGTDLFNYWGVGRKGINDGLLILVSKQDRKVAICTGYLTERFLPDPEAGRIIDAFMVPQFKKGNYGKGIIDAINEARRVMKKNRMLMYPEKHRR